MATLGTFLRMVREAKGQRPEAAAAEIGVSLSAYSRWESDRRVPQGDHLVAIARWAGCHVSELGPLVGATLTSRVESGSADPGYLNPSPAHAA